MRNFTNAELDRIQRVTNAIGELRCTGFLDYLEGTTAVYQVGRARIVIRYDGITAGLSVRVPRLLRSDVTVLRISGDEINRFLDGEWLDRLVKRIETDANRGALI